MNNSTIHKVIIIGAGCAGLSAGIYCARADLEPLIFSGELNDKGGLLVKTSIVENYPGFPEGILGFDLIQNMEKQASEAGANIIDREILSVDFSKKPLQLKDNYGDTYLSQTVIIATGSKPNKLHLQNEDKWWGRNISSCAVCDGALYKNKKIIVVGGGDTAMEEAQFLTKFSNVTLIHRKNTFRASKAMLRKVLENPKINILYNTCIDKLIGDDKLTTILVKNIITGDLREMKVDGLFYGLGLIPCTKIFLNHVPMDENGYILKTKHNSDSETQTMCSGVFVSGDSSDKHYKQAVVAAGEGVKAAMDVNNYLTMNN